MNREEIENRINICEKRAMDYREVGKTGIANRYDKEKWKWEKLLSDLDLLNERKINDLLAYKKGYYKQKEIIDKTIEILEKGITFCKNDSQGFYDICKTTIYREKSVLEMLREVSE